MSFWFGDFELDQERRLLLRSGEPVPLEPKAYELLSLLLERRPRALSRAQIRDVVWPQTFVSESTLAVVMNGIRQALGDDARAPRFIRTVHAFGYAFCGDVRETSELHAGSGEAVERPRPYPGLAAFTESDAGRFFGREREVDALWERVRARRLLAMIGPSGAGKTSFVRAGVAASRPRGWAAIVSTPGTAPLRELGRALAPEISADTEALRKLVDIDEPAVAFDVASRWRSRHGEALLVVDQFEELFTQCAGEAQARFASLLGRLATEAGLHVLLSMRDDFLMRCHEHAALAGVFAELTPLGPLAGEGLRRALEEPARAEGYRFEEGVVGEMTAAVEGERAALPLLAFAVSRLWDERDRERRLLTREAYAAIGGVAGALARHAEATLERVGTERQGIVREILRNLVTAQGTRAVADRDELLSLFPDRKVTEAALRELVDARLLTSFELEGKEGEPSRHRVEIAHESLLKAWPRLVRWQAQDEEGAVLRDQLKQAAHLWEEKGRTSDVLWTGTAYREYELWRERYPGAPTALEEDFARAMRSRAAQQRRRRRFAVAAAFGVLLVVLAVVGVLLRRAIEERWRAEAARLVALGRVELDRYPSATLAYARQSLEVADTLAARALAAEALWRAPSVRVLPVAYGGANGLAFSADGSLLVAPTHSPDVLVAARETGALRVVHGFPVPSFPTVPAVSPDGKTLVTRFSEGPDLYLRLGSLEDGHEIRRLSPGLLRPGAKVAGFWGPVANDRGIALFWIESTPRAPVRRLFWPWDGSEARPLPSAPWADSLEVNRELSVEVLARNGQVVATAFPAAPGVPERHVTTYEPGAPPDLCLSPLGNRLAVHPPKKAITVYDLEPPTPTRRWVLEAPREDVGSLLFDETGSRLLWGSPSEGALSVADLDGPPDAGPRALRRSDIPDPRSLANLGLGTYYLPHGSWLATNNESSIAFWQVGQPWARVIRGHTSALYQLVFAPDSRSLLSCGYDDLRRWPLDPAAGESDVVSTVSPVGACYGFAAAPDGREVARGFGGVVLAPVRGPGGRWLATETVPLNETHEAVAFDASGRWVAAGAGFKRPGTSMRLRVWERSSGALKHEWPLEIPGERQTAYSWGAHRVAFLDERHVLVAGSAGVRRFDVETGASEWLWRIDPAIWSDMAVSADGKVVAATGYSGPEAKDQRADPVVLDLATGTRRDICSHGPRVYSVALDPTGRVLVTGGNDGVVRVGRPDGSEPHLLYGHTAPVVTVAVSPDGKWVASGAGSEIRLWPMPDMAKPPLHALSRAELMAKLAALTNLRVVEDEASATGYRLEVGPFPGWKDAPDW